MSTKNHSSALDALRASVDDANFRILALLNERARLVERIQTVKDAVGVPAFVPEREQAMLAQLLDKNTGPFSDETIAHLFKEVFQASLELQGAHSDHVLLVSRARCAEDRVIEVPAPDGAPPVRIGAEAVVIAGPCSIESAEQMDVVGRRLSALGVRVLRGGAFKPRSSPYSFQGLGYQGLVLLRDTAKRYGMVSVTEVMDTRQVEMVAEHADILQIGARNMYNYDLLREVGRTRRPVLLKRGLSATLDEWLQSAEYVVREGNERVILCERGIRTFADETRYTLDISAVPLMRQKCCLPVLVDVSHAAGRRDILAPLARAALAAGAQGLMVEVHPNPAIALSDAQQQLDLDAFARFLVEVGAETKVASGIPTGVLACGADPIPDSGGPSAVKEPNGS